MNSNQVMGATQAFHQPEVIKQGDSRPSSFACKCLLSICNREVDKGPVFGDADLAEGGGQGYTPLSFSTLVSKCKTV